MGPCEQRVHTPASVTTEPGLTIVGLGPSGFDRIPPSVAGLLTDEDRTVVVRTIDHPAAAELAALRPIVTCDDVYESGADFDSIYAGIADRVIEAASSGPTTYATPGSAVVGERAVPLIRRLAEAAGIPVSVIPGESFLDPALVAVSVDPISDGLQVVDARDLPSPLHFHLPMFITQIDSQLVAADLVVTLTKVLPDHHEIVVLDRLGDDDETVLRLPLSDLLAAGHGKRFSVYVPPASVGLMGLVDINHTLRAECPWDREQTHHSLAGHLIEEAYETVDAIGSLPAAAPRGDIDFGAYAEVEEELGDLLLQIVFHATLAEETGAFDIEDVAEGIRRKLVRRHPHVFSDVEVGDVQDVLCNWEAIKQEEKGRESLMDDVPVALPGVARADKLQKRAASVGFDWEDADPVFAKVSEELGELREAPDVEAQLDELGDVLFAVVNLSRHLGVDPEIALARSNDRFSDRFRAMERIATERGLDMRSMSLDDLDALWSEAKLELEGPR